jgi:hypothetical protein
LGSLLLVATWTSPDWAAYVLLGVLIMGCGISGGLVIAYGPKSILAMAARVIRRGPSTDDLWTRILPGTLIGLVVGPIVLVVSLFIIAGLGRMSAPHSAPDLFTGAIFFVYLFGLRAIFTGAVVGAIVAAILNRRASLGVIALVTTAVTFATLLTWIFAH